MSVLTQHVTSAVSAAALIFELHCVRRWRYTATSCLVALAVQTKQAASDHNER